MKVLALDYGRARTGVAVSDPTGTVARPLEVVADAQTDDGLAALAEIVRREAPDRVVVGMPLTLRGEHGAQAEETQRFVEQLRAVVAMPVETFDERFTTTLAERGSGRGSAPSDARAAAHLLASYLSWLSKKRR